MKTVHPVLVTLTAASALFLVILDNTIVNVAIVPISRALGTDVHSVQWVVGAYFLAQAAVIPVSGYLGLRFGVKRVFLLAFALFVASSGLCGWARTDVELIFFRVLQGLGGGTLYPLAQSIAFGAFTGKDRIKAVSLTMIPAVLAPTLGPLSGGWLTLHYGWSSIFLINVPLGLLFLFLSWRLLPGDKRRSMRIPARFDTAGLALCVTGVLALTYGFSLVGTPEHGTVDQFHPQGRPHGWADPFTLSCLLLGLGTLAVFVWHELRQSDPVLDLRLFLRREFTVAAAIASVNNGIFFGSMLVIPFFLIHVRSPNWSSLDVGMMLVPQGVGSALMLANVGWLRRYFGVAPMIMTGTFLLALSSWGLAQVADKPDLDSFLPWIFLRGMGFGTVFQITQGIVVEGLSGAELPRTTSLFNVVRQISSSIGLALMLSLFGHWSASHASEQLLASGAGPMNAPLLQAAGVTAFHNLFQLLALLALLVLLLAALLPKALGASSKEGSEPSILPQPEAGSGS